MTDPAVIDIEALRRGDGLVFVGADHGGVAVSFILDRSLPGQGPALHRHPYDEVWILDEGHASFTAGDRSLTAGPGSVVIVPADTPHRFTNSGTTPLRMVCIHLNARMQTEWL
jgi:mannose-6-phosphate isomerase-like protein (cupin superfamily)